MKWILWVDDESHCFPIIRRLCRRVVDKVVIAGTIEGARGILKESEGRPAAVLLDMILPRGDGLSAFATESLGDEYDRHRRYTGLQLIEDVGLLESIVVLSMVSRDDLLLAGLPKQVKCFSKPELAFRLREFEETLEVIVNGSD